MERILRGVIQVGGVPEAEDALKNWVKLREHVIDFSSEDHDIYTYLSTFYAQMSAPPDFSIVREYFEKDDKLEAATRLDEIKGAQPYIGTNYLAILRSEEDKQQKKKFIFLMRDAGAIAETGRNLDKPVNGKKVLKGVNDAVNFVFENLHDFTRVETGEKLEGVVSDDAEEVIDEYETVKSTDQFANRNLFGLEPVDSVCRGHRRGEYWIHTAFAGELKSTLALNYTYNNAVIYGRNIFYAILEMPYTQLRRMLFVIHSSHGKFVSEWNREDLKRGVSPDNCYRGIDYRKVRDGELDEEEERRFRIVAQDFKATERGKIFVWRPPEEVGMLDIRRKAEMFHNKYGCDGLVVDHMGLVRPQRRTSDYVVGLNSVVRDGRLLALNFGRGRGVPLLALFQMNRQGKMRAEKNEGRYDMAAISYANECLVGDTLVQTQMGMIPIDSVEPGVHRVWSSTGWKGVKNRFDNGVRSVLLLRTADGLETKLTSSHTFRTLRNGRVTWTQACDLKPGDCVLSDFDSGKFPTQAPTLPALSVSKSERTLNRYGERLTVPPRLTETLAYLMGAHAGDGVFKRAPGVVGWCGNRAELFVKDRMIDSASDVFTQRFSVSESPSRPSVFDVSKQSKPLFRWFDAVGLNRKPGIPDVILRAPKSMAIAYVQGLMDTDGSVNSQGVISVGLKREMKRTLLDLKLILATLGIASTVCDGVSKLRGKTFERTCLRIRTRHSRELFARVIGFTEPSKQDVLMRFVHSTSGSQKAGDQTVWPVGEMLKEILARYPRSVPRKVKHALKTGNVSHGALLQFINLFRNVNDNDVVCLHRLVTTCRPCVVESITESGRARVYDLEVTGDHEYSTGGLFSHNCEKSADVITWTYLDDMLRKEGKFYLGNLKNRDNPLFDRMVGKILWQSKRMRAMKSGLLDTSNDSIMAAAKHISTLSLGDLLT